MDINQCLNQLFLDNYGSMTFNSSNNATCHPVMVDFNSHYKRSHVRQEYACVHGPALLIYELVNGHMHPMPSYCYNTARTVAGCGHYDTNRLCVHDYKKRVIFMICSRANWR